MFIAAWGEFCQTLEDVIVLTGLALVGEVRTIKLPNNSEEIASDGEGERKLEAMNNALSESKIKSKSSYSTWVRYFMYGACVKSYIEFEAMLANSCFA